MRLFRDFGSVGLLLLLGLLLSSGCERRNDSPVGYGELEREISDPVSLLIGSPSKDTTYSTLVPTGSSTSLLVGAFQSYEARALLRFEISDTQVTNHATQAKIRLYRQKKLGTEPLDVSLCGLREPWDEGSVTWTEADSVTPWTVPGGAVSDTIASAEMGETDSITFTIRNSGLSSVVNPSSNGLILISGNGAIVDFFSSETSTPPLLFVHYLMGNSAKVDTSSPEADAFIIYSDYEVPQDRLIIGDGYVFRALLDFDLPPIPERAIIDYGSLELSVDASQSSFDAMELGAHRVTGEWNGELTPFDEADTSTVEVASSDTSFEIDVGPLLQDCIPGDQLRLLLKSTSEVLDISRIALFSSGADSAKSPNLVIYYTVPPGFRGE